MLHTKRGAAGSVISAKSAAGRGPGSRPRARPAHDAPGGVAGRAGSGEARVEEEEGGAEELDDGLGQARVRVGAHVCRPPPPPVSLAVPPHLSPLARPPPLLP